jgi:glycosyltransferase involved in cell wall biosynthesis
MRLPDFIVIGAMKCATSTLHEQLVRQDDFIMSVPKEPNFFSDDDVWSRGLDWYGRLFAAAPDGVLCGESSTHYTKRPTRPDTVARMQDVLGDHVRFIYVMRHPVERLVSQFVHEWSMGRINVPLDEAIERHPELVDYGRYAMQLQPYVEAFGSERILPVFFERLTHAPQETLDDVMAFLDRIARPERGRPPAAPAPRHRSSDRPAGGHLPPPRAAARAAPAADDPALAPARAAAPLRPPGDGGDGGVRRGSRRARILAGAGPQLRDLRRCDPQRASAVGAAHEGARRMNTPPTNERVGVVVIGRNEGERLRCCLESVMDAAAAVVYVDSGSTDDSVVLAADLGAIVVELDPDQPFSAARARNTGVARLRGCRPDLDFVQVVDGDCTVVNDWWGAALTAIKADARIAVVCGRRREESPEASAYNRLCEMEWNTPIGEALSCGGDALIRLEALEDVGGYDATFIAGEEPELCLRLRRQGWRILRIGRDMTIHDAAMTRFGQWWRRAVRGGYAYAAGRDRHGDGPERFRVAEVRSILEWGVLLPVVAILLAWVTWGASLAALAAYGLLWLRIRNTMLGTGASSGDASLYARFCVLAKLAEAQGVVRFYRHRWLGRTATIIEYKDGARAPRNGEAAAA